MIGVLIVNLGTPSNTSIKAVREYLAEFLDDPRVIDLPKLVRKILLYGFILPFRPKQTAKAYAEIFDPQKGSPLLYHSIDLVEAIQQQLGEKYKVVLGMRYGEPKLSGAIDELLKAGCQKIVAIPLFPQYSSAVNGSALEAVFTHLQSLESIPSLTTISEFYNIQAFIDVQAAIIKNSFSNTSDSAIIFSYHSLPVRQNIKSSQGTNQTCYREKCFETSRLLAKSLSLKENQYAVAFQSKLGRTEWIGPDFNTVLKQLAEKGIKDLTVACPSFVVDCLETLEEIGIRGKAEWLRLNGRSYQLTPCLNADQEWAKVIASWIRNA